MKKLFLRLLVIVFFTACSSEKERQNRIDEKVITEWSERIIRFPQNITFTSHALDTMVYDIQKFDYKILVYTDSTGCTSCKLQLQKWKELISLTDSFAPGKIGYLFFFDSDMHKVRFLLKQADLNIPVCFDTNGLLNKLNHFPEETKYQTFLLDKNNRVLVIGNPATNLAIRNIYMDRIINNKTEIKKPI